MRDDRQANGHDEDGMSRDEMKLYASMQIQEIERYKWCLGVQLGHDPLRDRELNAIAMEWIDHYAAGFRAEYESHRQRRREANGRALSPAA